MDFTAIDFETANSSRSSACALGLVQVKAGVVTAEHAWLIDPQQRFDGMNIAIHGITPSMVRGKPTFAELWPTIAPLLQDQVVVAHNAAFDMSVLRYCLDDVSFDYPKFQYLCTYLLGKKMLPDLPSHKLNVISGHFGISLKHHDALDDARAAAAILLKLMEQEQHTDPLLLSSSKGYKTGTMYAGGYTPYSSPAKKPAKKTAKETVKKSAKLAPVKTSQPVAAAKSGASASKPIIPTLSPAGKFPVTPLIKGQRTDISRKLNTSKLLVQVQWERPTQEWELDSSAFLLNSAGRCMEDHDFVFYGNNASREASVSYTQPTPQQAQFAIDLDKLPADIDRISFALTLHDGEVRKQYLKPITGAELSLIDPQTGVIIASFPFGGGQMAQETAVVIGELYRYQGSWRFVAVGSGYFGGLRALCENYGLEVAAEEPESAASKER